MILVMNDQKIQIKAILFLGLGITISFWVSIVNFLNIDLNPFPRNSTSGFAEWIPYYLILVIGSVIFAVGVKILLTESGKRKHLFSAVVAGIILFVLSAMSNFWSGF